MDNKDIQDLKTMFADSLLLVTKVGVVKDRLFDITETLNIDIREKDKEPLYTDILAYPERMLRRIGWLLGYSNEHISFLIDKASDFDYEEVPIELKDYLEMSLEQLQKVMDEYYDNIHSDIDWDNELPFKKDEDSN